MRLTSCTKLKLILTTEIHLENTNLSLSDLCFEIITFFQNIVISGHEAPASGN
jgi:hypothetical protein